MKKLARPKQVAKILNGPGASSLQPLLSYANYLQNQSKRLRDSLSEPIASHIALANIRHGVATIVVDSSTWLGKVRYLAPTIQQTLIKQGLMINKVVFKADPTYHQGRKFEHPPAVMPATAGELLHDFANSVSNPKLQAALHRLAKHGKQTTD